MNYNRGQESWDTSAEARANYASFSLCSPFHLPLKMLVLTSSIGTFAVNIVCGEGGTLNTVSQTH